MVHSINRENNTWIFTYNEQSFLQNNLSDNKDYILLFGILNAGICISSKTNFTTLDFNTENELETYVDNFTETGYYKVQAETQGVKYIGVSEKYPIIEPVIEEN